MSHKSGSTGNVFGRTALSRLDAEPSSSVPWRDDAFSSLFWKFSAVVLLAI
ncbi:MULTISPECIES: hypothetical protein [unclassified Sphingobium]|jgi:hypothetical protein|uniref:hypothetical protein n=1 Tax=unclassified Sphingobium TaxID=2611147 RepID=UPI00342D708B